MLSLVTGQAGNPRDTNGGKYVEYSSANPSNLADLPMVRQHLTNKAWYVRVQAATALGKLGTVHDEERLIGLFNDE